MILAPDYTTAQSFYSGSLGQAWKAEADLRGFTLIIVEADQGQGGAWNLLNATWQRNDDDFLYEIVDTIRQKFSSIPAAFNLDERSLYLVGYEQGGSAAHKMAISWPQLFGGIVSIGGSNVSDELITRNGGKRSFPFIAGQNSDGRETIGLLNQDIPLPAWIVEAANSELNSLTIKNHWINAADAISGSPNIYAQETYSNGATNIWITYSTAATPSPSIIYEEFLYQVLRYTNTPGGVLEYRVRLISGSVPGTGFVYSEDTVGGRLRKWWTYIPTTYNENNSYPLIVALHGGSNSAEAFIGDSRWHLYAEQYGLIVVFPQAFPCPLPFFGWIPVPVWNQYIITPGDPPDDVAFIRHVINQTKTNYAVDAEKVFATGHSNGAGMTWRLGLDAPEIFAAIAPAGWTVSATPGGQSVPPISVPLPVWLFMGRYDQMGADAFSLGNSNDTCIKYWAQRNGFNYKKLCTEYDTSGNYYSRIWTNGVDSIPLFQFTTVADCPHIYVPYECELLWTQFFSKLRLASDAARQAMNKGSAG